MHYTLGKFLVTADTLFRSPVTATSTCIETARKVENHAQSITNSLPVSDENLVDFFRAQSAKSTLTEVQEKIRGTWPKNESVTSQLGSYLSHRHKLHTKWDINLRRQVSCAWQPESRDAPQITRRAFGNLKVQRKSQAVAMVDKIVQGQTNRNEPMFVRDFPKRA